MVDGSSSAAFDTPVDPATTAAAVFAAEDVDAAPAPAADEEARAARAFATILALACL